MFVLCLLLVPFIASAQDPSCEFIITLNEVDTNRYAYFFITQDRYEKESLSELKSVITKRLFTRGLHTENTLLRSEQGTQLIRSRRRRYCYPSPRIKKQLRIIVARQDKERKRIEFMIGRSKLRSGQTNIMISQFERGKKNYELFEFEGRYQMEVNGHSGSSDNNLLRAYVIFMN